MKLLAIVISIVGLLTVGQVFANEPTAPEAAPSATAPESTESEVKKPESASAETGTKVAKKGGKHKKHPKKDASAN